MVSTDLLLETDSVTDTTPVTRVSATTVTTPPGASSSNTSPPSPAAAGKSNRAARGVAGARLRGVTAEVVLVAVVMEEVVVIEGAGLTGVTGDMCGGGWAGLTPGLTPGLKPGLEAGGRTA